jgi:hypothetical protein
MAVRFILAHDRDATHAAATAAPKSAPLLLCSACKLEMRLVGIEVEEPGRDLFTFECDACKRLEARSARLQ